MQPYFSINIFLPDKSWIIRSYCSEYHTDFLTPWNRSWLVSQTLYQLSKIFTVKRLTMDHLKIFHKCWDLSVDKTFLVLLIANNCKPFGDSKKTKIKMILDWTWQTPGFFGNLVCQTMTHTYNSMPHYHLKQIFSNTILCV